ncbi:MAG: cupin domain-containing protein [Gammaproteobacteria bacterium]|jgi:50S ribosomal protein L16 3-hydroxylase|nr:cupin domain-containing protein [Gammaproteobacteria bacterium]
MLPLTHLGDLPIEEFLRDYWQQKPVCIRNAFANMEPLIAADELAGLSLEPEVESRLVENEGDILDWRLHHGPMQEHDFAKQRDYPWTLLVQGVDHFVPAAFDLVAKFRFIPAWRFDDVMISYATKGAGVGAHYDRYDVFLIQGEGQRRWQTGQVCNSESKLAAHKDLCLLQDFVTEQTFDLHPGDLLYIPPLVAHQGVALSDNCMTYSVGFRAPSHSEVMGGFADFIGQQLSPDLRLCNSLQPQPAGEISANDLANLRAVINQQLNDENLAQWFGCMTTEPKNSSLDYSEEAMDKAELATIMQDAYGVIRVAEGVRLAYTWQGDGGMTLFAQGEAIACPPEATDLAMALANQLVIEVTDLACLITTEASQALLLVLHNQGWIYFDDE